MPPSDMRQPGDMRQPDDMRQPVRAVLINFDDVSGDITDQYKADAVFSTTAGLTHKTLASAEYFKSSKPNFACATSTCTGPSYVDFTQPVSMLSFLAVGVNNNGSIADVNVFVRGAKVATVPIVGAAMDTKPVLVDLSAYADITRIEVVNITDLSGIGYDDFKFLTY